MAGWSEGGDGGTEGCTGGSGGSHVGKPSEAGGGSGRGELFGRQAAKQVGRAGRRRSPEACTRPAVRNARVGRAGVGGGGGGACMEVGTGR